MKDCLNSLETQNVFSGLGLQGQRLLLNDVDLSGAG